MSSPAPQLAAAPRSPFDRTAMFGWAALLATVNLLSLAWPHSSFGVLAVSLIGVAATLAGFWSFGGRTVNSCSLWSLANLLFVFVPPLYLLAAHRTMVVEEPSAMQLTLNLCLLAFLLSTIAMGPARFAATAQPEDVGVPRAVLVALGFALVLGASVLTRTNFAGQLDVVINAAAFTGSVLVAVASLHRTGRVGPVSLLLPVVAFSIYALFIFAGFGRLTLAALAASLLMIYSAKVRHHWLKLLTLVVMPMGLWVLALNRQELNASLGSTATETGIESAISPFAFCTKLLTDIGNGSFPMNWGQVYWAPLVVWVPRSVWPDKPIGFGAQLTAAYRPELAAAGHSDLALYAGEWASAFGVLSLPLAGVLMGLIFRYWDQMLARVRCFTVSGLVWLAGGAIISASVFDFVWGGAFSYVARVLPRLGVLAGVLAVSYIALPSPLTGVGGAQRVEPPVLQRRPLLPWVVELARRWRVLLATTSLGMAAALLVGLLATPTYSGTATLFYSTQGPDELASTTALTLQQAQQGADLATSDAVLAPVLDRLQLDLDPAELAARVSGNIPLHTSMLQVVAEDGDRTQAANIANAVAQQIVGLSRSLVPSRADGTRIVQVQLISPAHPATHRTAPDLAELLALGALSGLLLGGLASSLGVSVDRRLHTRQQLASATGVPVLADAQGRDKHSAWDSLAAAMTFDLPRKLEHGSLVMLTSVDGRGAVGECGLGVARALATQSRRVVLVEANPVEGSAVRRLGLNPPAGLAEVVLGDVDLGEALCETGIDGLRVLGPGRSSGATGALLQSDRTQDMLQSLKTRCDVVVLVAPPAGQAATLRLAELAHDTALLVTAHQSRRQAVADAISDLKATRTRVRGSVLIDPPPVRA